MRRFALAPAVEPRADDGFRPRRILVAVAFGTPAARLTPWSGGGDVPPAATRRPA